MASTSAYTTYDHANNIFNVKNIDGSIDTTLTGQDALIAADPLSHHFSPNKKTQDILIAARPNDPRHGSARYKLFRTLQDIADSPNPTLPGRILNQGPLVGGGAGALAGFGAGAIADWVLDKINGGQRDSLIKLKWLGALLGGGTGATLGHYRKKNNSGAAAETWPTQLMLTKHAAMYADPRNFILEKLQGARDLGYAEKAKLASAVRNMDSTSARKLADMVRASLGFGVGAIIARFLFGMNSVRGTMFGGLVGLLGTGLYNKFMR